MRLDMLGRKVKPVEDGHPNLSELSLPCLTDEHDGCMWRACECECHADDDPIYHYDEWN